MQAVFTTVLVVALPLTLGHNYFKYDNTTSPDYFKNLHEIQRLFVHEYWVNRSFPNNLTKTCTQDMAQYLKQLKRGNVLALQISDASGRYQGSAWLINDFWVGSKTLCQDVNARLAGNFNISRVGFSVTRMTIKIPPIYQAKNVIGDINSLAIGQCLPRSCSASDVKSMMASDPAVLALQSSHNRINDLEILNSKLVPGTYELYKDNKFIIACGITGFLAALVILATILEGSMCLNESKLDGEAVKNAAKRRSRSTEFILCFAIGSNAKKIFALTPASNELITCIHGLRTISMIWIILGHTILMMYTIGANKLIRIEDPQSLQSLIVTGSHYAVDTFFFMSGFLMVIMFLEKSKTVKSKWKSPIQWIKNTGLLILYRYVRLTPVYMLVLLYSVLGMKYAYNQTVFPNNPDLLDHITCEKYWWRNVLYINNWYPKDEICIIWSWFLANDMQFFVMGMILLFISLRFFKTAVSLLIGVLISSWAISATLSLSHGYKYRIGFPFEAFDYLFAKPWNRVGDYIIGMITGGIYDRYRTPPKVPRMLNLSLWIVSLLIHNGLLFGLRNDEMPVVLTAFVVSVYRTLWSCGLVWILLSCCWGLAPPINAFLSWGAWIPLSRLSYCAYLIHPLLQAILYHILETPVPFHPIIAVAVFLGSILFTYQIALLLSLLLEAPVIRLLRLLVRK